MGQAQKRFGVVTLTALVVANMIGVGVFVTSGYALADLGSPVRVLCAWLVGGGIALCGAAGYGALAQRRPESGGEYLYLSKDLHPTVGFVAGWISLTAGFSAPIAAAALVFQDHLPAAPQSFLNSSPVVPVGLILLAALSHGSSFRSGARVQTVAVVLQVLVLLAMIAVSVASGHHHGLHWDPVGDAGTKPVGELIPAFAQSLVFISMSFAGFNAAVYVASEAESSSIRRAMLIGTGLVLVLYVAANFIILTVAPASVLAGQEEVALVAAKAVDAMSPESRVSLSTMVRWCVLFGTGTSVFAMLMAGPRVYEKMAADGNFPAFFGGGDRGIRRTIALQSLFAVALVLSAEIKSIVEYLGASLSLCSGLAVLTLFLRPPRPTAARVLVPAGIYVLATFGTVGLMLSMPLFAMHRYALLGTIISGIVLWLFTRRH